ncbi:MAG: hypothetical protein KJS97_02760 [Alphaproteobacteria bacterium]|nr:hypothetical protein [Alphaproteobacteria bacterium]
MRTLSSASLSKTDFADALFACAGEIAGARETPTFDQTAAAAFGMRLLA